MVEDDHEKPAVDGPWTTENVRFQVAKGSLSHRETMGFHPYLLQGVPYFYVFPQKSLGKPWEALGKALGNPSKNLGKSPNFLACQAALRVLRLRCHCCRTRWLCSKTYDWERYW